MPDEVVSAEAPVEPEVPVEPEISMDLSTELEPGLVAAEEPPVEGATEEAPPAEIAEAPSEEIQYGDFDFGEMVKPDTETLSEFLAVAKANKISQAEAQKFIDMQAALTKKHAEKATSFFKNRAETWKQEVLKDETIGGKKHVESMGVVLNAINTFDPDRKVVKLLEQHGLGNNPDIVRMFYKAGKAISNDSLPAGKAAPGSAVNNKSLAGDPFTRLGQIYYNK